MAQLSVRVMPVAAVASSRAKSGYLRGRGTAGSRERADAAVFSRMMSFIARFSSVRRSRRGRGPFVHQLGQRLGEAVAEGLSHDGVVVVVRGFELGGEFFDPWPAVTAKPPMKSRRPLSRGAI